MGKGLYPSSLISSLSQLNVLIFAYLCSKKHGSAHINLADEFQILKVGMGDGFFSCEGRMHGCLSACLTELFLRSVMVKAVEFSRIIVLLGHFISNNLRSDLNHMMRNIIS